MNSKTVSVSIQEYPFSYNALPIKCDITGPGTLIKRRQNINGTIENSAKLNPL